MELAGSAAPAAVGYFKVSWCGVCVCVYVRMFVCIITTIAIVVVVGGYSEVSCVRVVTTNLIYIIELKRATEVAFTRILLVP